MGVEAEENGVGSVKVRALNVAANEEDNDCSRCSRRPAIVGASGTTLPFAMNLRVWPSIEAGMLLLYTLAVVEALVEALVEVLVVSGLCLELAPLVRSTTTTLILSPWDNW